ncbi:hypothetical protein WH47_00652 [Habropoda laboriosa]|uniref:Uncharacterized protein n=1 Tax=Habropoda laboriosa TaxID=597456 RepID=A0A0L7RHQ5_9HYME|nr:PREDICTED: uncharacterized protein LOC108575031 [Habropoda laboriosa]KOC70507.1 hypothetical protein WH47_00652 [Habropoda laboriosa]
MFVSCGYLLISVLAVVSGAPKRTIRSTLPMWHLPCGDQIEIEQVPASLVNVEKEVRISIESLRLQHRVAMDDYLNRDYEYLYERVRIGVHEHQYIPNWVPSKKDVNTIKKLTHATPQTIANHFPKLHLDLQKFAVAFEELVDDETNPRIYEALKATQSYLMMMLCEVESYIIALPDLRVPSRVERSIMSNTEREPVDDTRRLVRDWGVLLKYRDYLHAWRHVFDY